MDKKNFVPPFKGMENAPYSWWEDPMYFLNLKKRALWINGEIDETTVETMKHIILWNQEDNEANVPLEERMPIKLYIFSEGGEADVGDSMFELIKSSKTKVIGYNMGLVASAAFDIYIACHERITLPGAKFLIHEGSMRISGQTSSVENYGDLSKKVKARMIDRITKETNITKKTLENKIKSDWWFFGDEALKLEVAHRLWTPEDLA